MPETLVTLLAAHLLGDFPFQPSWMVRRKRNPLVLLLHVSLVTLLVALLLGKLYWPILAVTFASHLIIDGLKSLLPDRWQWFLLDQLAHLAVLVGLTVYYENAASTGWWATNLPSPGLPWYYAGLSLIAGSIVVIQMGGILIGKFTAPFVDEIREYLTKQGEEYQKGLTGGGKIIGWLERTVALLLIIINQPTGIGFLIAAKSILRFGEIKERKDRMFAEYVLIGTLLSFTWALVFAILTKQAIEHWLP